MTPAEAGRITAVLGPTNTGKTFLAIERMLGYRSGIIGFPLRLLARENYDRAVAVKGPRQVALVTGEEKIIPPQARYFFCTVESMPLDRPVAFLAVDEIQLCADAERGHVFTDRLLHARGSEETMFLGADTIRPVLRRLVPEAQIIARPRFSTLTYAGPRKLTRLPPRSAVIAFSAAQVYTLAELIRRQRGGTAVVLGALSPRTRNAQVALFEAGEVDYLVATDAIGMGLNLSLDHVAFSQLSKFDGFGPRRLSPAEVAQIAGRAGRHMNDGSFGTTDSLAAMDAALVQAIEEHRFDPLQSIFWRSRDFDFRSPQALLRSLEARPKERVLLRVRDAEDHQALAALSRDPEIARMASHPAAVRLLWDVCQVPDFQKTLTDQHARLLARTYRFLMAEPNRLPEDWVARQIARIDRTEGDIDALVARIAHVRTWTYIAHRDWLADPAHWQERSRALEDKLSDALHERLTQRFVDRRAAMLVRRLKAGDQLLAAVRVDGAVLVEGAYVGRLTGFRFDPDRTEDSDGTRAVLTAARRALANEIPRRVRRLEGDDDGSFMLDERGGIAWRGAAVARLAAGASALAPQVEMLPSEFLDGAQRERLRLRLADWLGRHLRRQLAPLYRVLDPPLSGAARGLAFQLVEALGTLPRGQVTHQIASLGKAERKALAALGIRLGAASVTLPALLKPRPSRLRGLLWAVRKGGDGDALPDLSDTSFRPQPGMTNDDGLYLALGYRRFARKGEQIAVRADALERLAREAYRLARQGSFAANPALQRLAGCDAPGLALLLGSLGFRVTNGPSGVSFAPRPSGSKARANGHANGAGPPMAKSGAKRRRPKPTEQDNRGTLERSSGTEDSPFAKLRELKIAR
jgi:ATP-dependent RNA helicase SUPV3L1/SUV3